MIDTLVTISVILWLNCPLGKKVLVEGELSIPYNNIAGCSDKILTTQGLVLIEDTKPISPKDSFNIQK